MIVGLEDEVLLKIVPPANPPLGADRKALIPVILKLSRLEAAAGRVTLLMIQVPAPNCIRPTTPGEGNAARAPESVGSPCPS